MSSTLSSSDIDRIAMRTVELLRQERDLYSYTKKRAVQQELLMKNKLTLKEVSESELLGKITRQGLFGKCKRGDYQEGVAWYSDAEGRIFMIPEWIKSERKMLGL